MLNHLKKRGRTALKLANGALKLGGRLSPLHKESPWHKPYAYIKDGDMWRTFVKMVDAKGVEAVDITKVKGHATDEAVFAGTIRAEDKEGNDDADRGADKGSGKHRKRYWS